MEYVQSAIIYTCNKVSLYRISHNSVVRSQDVAMPVSWLINNECKTVHG